MSGGAILGEDFSILDSDFVSNSATGDSTNGGGAILALSFVTVSHSRFANNTVGTIGGAIEGQQQLLIDHSMFTGNMATAGDGGAVVGWDGMTLDHDIFSANHSGQNGGALAVTGTLMISSSLLTGNSAVTGGGLYQYAGAGLVVNSLFASNSTASQAGMQLYLAPTGTLQLFHNTIGAPILAFGDAIRVSGGSVQLYDTLITSHTTGLQRVAGAVIQDYNLFFGNTANILGGTIGGGHNASGDPALRRARGRATITCGRAAPPSTPALTTGRDG